MSKKKYDLEDRLLEYSIKIIRCSMFDVKILIISCLRVLVARREVSKKHEKSQYSPGR